MYDRRITLYSQQVRALSLVHALNEEGSLPIRGDIAVIGGGAAGITAAAAAALATTNGSIVLFEREAELLSLQSATSKRSLDPHIFDWPEWDSDDPIADLPILDWKAGTAQEVRKILIREFEEIVAALKPRIQCWKRHEVKAINPTEDSFEIVFERDSHGEEPSGRREDRYRFHTVFIAVGFGIEPLSSLPGIHTPSYWSDAGVPTAEFEGRISPRFFVSGNGDGALIDLIAAGSASFDHAQMIRTIVAHPGIREIFKSMRELDSEARAAESRGESFDFMAGYDQKILPTIMSLGILTKVRSQLRPGVQLTLQTRHREIFVVTSSPLNRIAAYLMIKACTAAPDSAFRHVHCSEIKVVPLEETTSGEAGFCIDCEGMSITADSVIVRRGPNKSKVRAPFNPLLAEFEAAHNKWLTHHGDVTLIPRLSPEARAFFESRSRTKQLPPAVHIRSRLAEMGTKTIQVRSEGGNIRWSGTLPLDEIPSVWTPGTGRVEIVCPSQPSEIGSVAHALVRLVAHSSNCVLVANPRYWDEFAAELTSESGHSDGLNVYPIQQEVGPVNRDPREFTPIELAGTINQLLDRFVLTSINDHIEEFLTTGRDPLHRVGFDAAPTLRLAMLTIWRQWKAAFDANNSLLSRYLRLLICAVESDAPNFHPEVPIGPVKMTSLIGGTTIALAIATGWPTIEPQITAPGNLLRRGIGVGTWSGHTCAADRISRQPILQCASEFVWKTNFVVVSKNGSIDVATRSEQAFSTTAMDQPSLSDSVGAGPILISIDAALTRAMQDGPEAVTMLLEGIELRHFLKLEKNILKATENQPL